MEKTSNDVVNLSNIPTEIQQEIAAYLDAPALCFFGMSDKQRLQTTLPLLLQFKALFPLRLTAKGNGILAQVHQLFGCGANFCGQLGLNNTNPRIAIFTAMPWLAEQGRIRQAVASGGHTLVLTDDNRLWVCGHNEYGQLGLGDYKNRLTFTTVSWPKEQGRICQVIAGGTHTLVLTDDHRLWGCGYNHAGQLGLDDRQNRANFTEVPWSAERGRIKQVVIGGLHTLVLTEDSTLWGCGHNEYGQLGLDDYKNRLTFTAVSWLGERGRIEQVIAGGYHTVVLTQANRLWACGANEKGQLGLGDNKARSTFTEVPWPVEQGHIRQVIAGTDHTLVLTENNTLWGCGDNGFGQLGLDNKKSFTTFIAMPWPENRGKIQQVIAGCWSHTVVLTENNRLWVCGNNEHGQLGLGDCKNRADFTLVKKLPKAMQQLFTLNNTLNQLITLGTALTLTPSTKSNTFYTQHQPDEPKGQPFLRKRGCNLQ